MSSWQYNPGTSPYVYAQPQVRATGRIGTSRTEVTHILVAASVMTVALAIISTRLLFLVSLGPAAAAQVIEALAVGAAAALTAFVFHELAHKIVAQRRGFWAEFRMSPAGLGIALMTALIGFLYAAPGATVVQGMWDRRDWGVTSLAGPVTNLVQGGAFLAAAFFVFRLDGSALLLSALLLLAYFNGWFAAFNLIPLGPLDGRKVLSWSLPIWIAFFAIAALVAGAAFVLNNGIVSF